MTAAHASNEIPLRELRSELGVVIDETRFTGRRTVVTRNGRPVAAIVSIEDMELLDKIEEKEDVVAFRQALKEDNGERITWAEFLAQDANAE